MESWRAGVVNVGVWPDATVPAALPYLGLNPNSTDDKELQRAADLMLKIRSSVRKFHSSEYLNALADKGATVRLAAVRSVESILRNPGVTVVAQTRKLFLNGFILYRARADKGYSLTDCVSMTIMRQRRISEAVTTDHHFEQEGFAALMRQ